MSTPEGRIKTLVKVALTRAFGDECWRFMPVQTGMGIPALDFILCFRGHFITVETKTPTGRLTPMQKDTRRRTLVAGGLVYCVYDEFTLSYFIDHIRQLEFIHGRYDDQQPPPLHSQDKGERHQHGKAEQPNEEADGAAGGDHGAPRKTPRRRAQQSARRHDQPVTTTVTPMKRRPRGCHTNAMLDRDFWDEQFNED